MARVGKGRGARGKGRGNTNTLDALLTCGVVWYDRLIEILLFMYEEKYIGWKYNPVAKYQ